MRRILREHISYSRQIFALARVDLIKHYRGSALGFVWAFIQPVLQIFVFWFMIHVGLKASTSTENVPFIVWLTIGMLPWFFMSDMINRGMESFRSYKYLITKVKFPISVIPTFVGISNLITHSVLLGATLIYMIVTGIPFSWTLVQLPIYTALMFSFFQGWALLTAPLALLSKDFSLAVRSVSRLLLFVSGIMYDVRNLDIGWIRNAMPYNPISFFVEGYRNSMIYGTWIWESPRNLLIFLVELVFVTSAAILMLKRTRSHLGDVI